MRIVIKLTFLHPTPINKLFLYLINSHILELTGIQRRLSDRWLNGHIVRLLNLLALVRLTLLIVNSKVIACQILSRNPFDIINRYSHDDIFIIQYLIDIPLIDKSILQKVGLKVIGFHTQVKIPTHTGFDGLHNPWFKIALGYLPNSLQQLLFNTFVGFKTPLIIIIRRNTGNNISSLFTKCHGRGIPSQKFTINRQFVQQTGLTAITEQLHTDFQRSFILMTVLHPLIDQHDRGIPRKLGVVLHTPLDVQIRIDFTLGSSFGM